MNNTPIDRPSQNDKLEVHIYPMTYIRNPSKSNYEKELNPINLKCRTKVEQMWFYVPTRIRSGLNNTEALPIHLYQQSQ